MDDFLSLSFDSAYDSSSNDAAGDWDFWAGASGLATARGGELVNSSTIKLGAGQRHMLDYSVAAFIDGANNGAELTTAVRTVLQNADGYFNTYFYPDGDYSSVSDGVTISSIGTTSIQGEYTTQSGTAFYTTGDDDVHVQLHVWGATGASVTLAQSVVKVTSWNV